MPGVEKVLPDRDALGWTPTPAANGYCTRKNDRYAFYNGFVSQ